MQFMAVLLILIGAFLTDSAVKNRSPKGLIEALIKDPSDLRGTITALNGQWTSVTSATSDGIGKNVGESGIPKSGQTTVTETGTSGKLPDSALSPIGFAPTHRLVPEAARALEALNIAYRAQFGKDIAISDSYRTYASQVATKAAKGFLAATPGKSVHGWGRALDLGRPLNVNTSAEHKWMVANGPNYGWVWPSWARSTKFEPWHFEYQKG